MKIIDEKGKLFGKINVIDFLIIIFFISLTPMFYYGYNIFHKKPVSPVSSVAQNVETQKKEFVEVELSFLFKKIPPQALNLISIGNKEIGKDEEVIGEILSLGEVRPYGYEVVFGSAKKVIVDSVFKDLPVTLKIKAEVRQNNLYYKDRQITDNSSIDFVTDKYKLEAFYMPNLIENNNMVEDVSDSVKIIQQKQKEQEYAVSKLQNKVDFLQNKVDSMENKISSVENVLTTNKESVKKK